MSITQTTTVYFLGGVLHGQTLEDSGKQTYRHRHGGKPKQSLGRSGWVPAMPADVATYERHESLPVYCLVNYEPTPEDEEAAREWLCALVGAA